MIGKWMVLVEWAVREAMGFFVVNNGAIVILKLIVHYVMETRRKRERLWCLIWSFNYVLHGIILFFT